MINFTERAVPNVSANFLMREAQSRYHYIKKFIGRTDTVLDMASGTGYGSNIIAEKAALVVGIDISDEALLFAKNNFPKENLGFIKMDVHKTLFQDKAFSVIVGFEMIEHLQKPKVFLKEVDRLLSKNGYFLVSTPNRLTQSKDGEVMSPYHTKEFSPAELETLLRPFFKSVEIVGQSKNDRAGESVDQFMKSQGARQFFVDIDIFSIRKRIPQEVKERVWKRVGGLFGRNAQEKVTEKDFIFSKRNINQSEYLIAICKK